jgi:hypothetical protein
MRRSLVLKKESLAELTTVELAVVNGGATADCVDPSGPCMYTYRYDCLLSRVMAHCPTDPTVVCD